MTPNQSLDDIIFRCFAQGQYWGTEKDGKLDPDYKPDNPIDRTEANKLVKSLFLEILVAQKAHVLSSYKDEVDDEAREQNAALYDYALFQLDSIGKKWEQL